MYLYPDSTYLHSMRVNKQVFFKLLVIANFEADT